MTDAEVTAFKTATIEATTKVEAAAQVGVETTKVAAAA